MIKFHIIVFSLILLSPVKINAQDDLSIDSLDKKMEELFVNKKWNEIISLGKKALAVNIETYFLRVRLGIAYYQTKKYFDAIPNFEKAIDIAYPEPEVLRFLYYSYVITGRMEDANYTYFLMPESEKIKIKPLENSFVNDLIIESGLGISNDYDKNSSIDLDGTDNIYGEQILSGNNFFVNGGIRQLPLKWLGILYDYTYMKTDREKQIQFNNTKNSDSYSQIQNQFYNKFDIRAAKGLVISPAGRYIKLEDNTIYSNYDSASYTYNPNTMAYDSVEYYYTLFNQQNISDNFVLSVAVFKYISIFKFEVNGSFSYLNNNHQSQYGLSFKSFPYGKVNFYTNTDLVLHNQNKVSNIIFTQLFGGEIYKNLWLEGFGTYGNMSNYNEQNGYIVYNNPDVINYKFGAELKYYFPINLTVSILYQFQERTKNYLTYFFPDAAITGSSTNFPGAEHELMQVNYQMNIFLAGIKLFF